MFSSFSPADYELAREYLSTARARGVKSTFNRNSLKDDEQMKLVLQRARRLASDRQFAWAKRISEVLGIELTPAMALDRHECSKFIEKHKTAFEERAPSEAQTELAERFAQLKGINVPSDVYRNLAAWNLFFEQHWTEQDHIAVTDVISELREVPGNLSSWGERVAYLELASSVLRSPEDLEAAKRDRMAEMLLGGYHPYTVAEVFDVDVKAVMEVACDTDGCDPFSYDLP